MKPCPVFSGKVSDDGTLQLSEDEKFARRQHLLNLAGKDVDVVVRRKRSQRSLDMNAYLHAVPFPILADLFGDDIEGTKWSLMGECFGWKRCKVTGRDVPIKPHTSEMTVEESTYFVDWLIPWAQMNHGAVIPLPAESDWEVS
jgi:hypothetical protein